MYSVDKEYELNREFRNYVEMYCKKHNTTPEESLKRVMIYLVGKSCYDKRKDVRE